MSHLLVKKVFTAFILLIPFCFYAIDPAFLWSTHHIMYLPPALAFGILGVCLLIVWNDTLSTKLYNILQSQNKILPLLIVGLLIMWLLPTESSAYGDSRSIANRFADYEGDLSLEKILGRLFHPNLFHLNTGERFSFSIFSLVMNLTGGEFKTVMKGIALFWGGCTLGAWLWFLKKELPKLLIPGFFLLMGSYAFQNFHGHPEVYAASIFFVSLSTILLVHSFLHNNLKNRLLTSLVVLLAIKSHILNWVFVIGVMHLYIASWKKLPVKLKNFLSIPFQIRLFIPIGLAVFLAIYFFVLDIDQTSYRGSHDNIRTVFLPIFPVEAPYDKYALLHGWHILDFGNTIFGWGIMCAAVMVFANFKGVLEKRVERFDVLGVIILPFAAYFIVLFFFNPLIGLPRDWDLFSQITPLAIMLTLLLLEKYKPSFQKVVVICIYASVPILLCRPIVETTSNFQYRRLLDVGAHLHKTYKDGSVVFLVQGLDMMDPWDDDLLLEMVDKMEKEATEGNDISFGHFLTQIGVRLNEKERFNDAIYYLEKALLYGPGYEMALRNAGIALMQIGRYADGLYCAEELLKKGRDLVYYQIAINCAYELQDVPKILEHCNGLLALDPQNKTAREILRQFE